VRIVSWNVRSGGGPRRRAIADAAAAFDADIIVLSEYQRVAGELELQALLARHGYPGWVDSGPTEKLLGVAIAARRPLTDEKISDPFPPWSGMVGARVDDVLVVGLYSPGSASVVGEKKIKRSWWDGVEDCSTERTCGATSGAFSSVI
jgi:exonuclease III